MRLLLVEREHPEQVYGLRGKVDISGQLPLIRTGCGVGYVLKDR